MIVGPGTFAKDVQAEIEKARGKHPPIHSLHEGYAVILEELDEVKAEVWKKSSLRNLSALRMELIQVAAMCQRVAEDLKL